MNHLKLIYIAAPFFVGEQVIVVENIEKILTSLEIKYFSPRKECLFKKTDPPEKAAETFNANIDAINRSDLIITVIDNYDAGTLFEMGYAYGQKKNILAYSSVSKRGLNLMLSQSCIAFANGIRDLADKLVRIDSGNYQKEEFKGRNI